MDQDLFEGRCSEEQQVVSRRRVLALMGTGGGIAAVALLSGCSFGGGSDTTASTSSTTTTLQTTTSAPTQAPAQSTTPTQAVATHTGTVVGTASQGVNSGKTFVEPGNNANAIVVRLGNGNFVAYESSCTHEGVTVDYDPGTQKLICPRHQAVFDPGNGAAVLSGPAPGPLPKVTIHVNADGTITV